MAKITFTRSNSANILTPSSGHASLFIDSADGYIKVRNPDGTITSYGPSGAISEANAYTDQKISELVDSAPGLLDTLNELAAALGDDANFAATVTGLISDEAAARLSADNDLQDLIDAETLARENADQDLQDAIDLVDAKEFVYEYADLASFPAIGEAQRIYIAKDTNYQYRFEQVVLPESYDWVVGSGGDFSTLHDAMASASVLDGHKIQVLNGTYESNVQLNISKKVKIYGESRAGVILQTSASTSAPVTMINVSVDDVLLKDMTIKHRKTNNTSVETAVVASGGGFPQTRISNFIMDNCLVEHVEFGVVSRGTGWMVSNSTISYMGGTNSTRRHMGVYGFAGDCFVMNNVFKDNAASGSARAIAITSTTGTNPNETNEGNLLVEGNTQEGPMAQFISQDNWQGSAMSYNLYVKNNTTNETSAFISFYGTSANFGNILGDVTVEGNSISNNHEVATGLGKGLIGIDGAGSSLSFRSSALLVHEQSNTLGQLSFRADYAEASGSFGSLVGYKTAVFNQPQVSQDSSIGMYPGAPAVPSAGGGTSSEYIKLSPDTGLLKLDGSRAMEAALDMGGFKVSNAATPTLVGDLTTKGYVDQKVADLVNSAPSVLDTLKELADALGNDADFSTTVSNQLGSLDGRLDALEADPVTKTYVDGEISGLDSRLDALELDPVTKTYVDGADSDLQDAIDLKQDSLGTGLISQFLRGDLSWSALASTDISDFASAAKAAAVADSITDGVTDVAPSQNAVYDALALKQDSLGTGTSGQYLRGDLTWHAEKYIDTLSWSGSGPYTMSIPASTHGQGTDPSIDIRELDGSDWVDCVTVEVRINASGDITISNAENISGKVVIK